MHGWVWRDTSAQKQRQYNAIHAVYYCSGKTTPAEERYTSYKLKILTIVKSFKKFRVYLDIPFKIITDSCVHGHNEQKDLCVHVAR